MGLTGSLGRCLVKLGVARALRLRSRLVVLVVSVSAFSVFAAGASADPFVYVANSSDASVSQFNADADGVLDPDNPAAVAVQYLPESLAVSPDGRSVYVVNSGKEGGTVSEFDVMADGTLTPKNPATVLAEFNPDWIAVSPDGSSAYVLTYDDVAEFSVGTDGVLTAVGTIATSATPEEMAVSPDSHHVYVTTDANTVDEFAVGAGGVLTSVGTVATGNGPVGVAVSPDGGSVYVTNTGDNTVSEFNVGADGLLSPKIVPTVATGNSPDDIAVSPDGSHVYVVNPPDNSVSEFNVGAGGVLSANPPATATGTAPVGVTVSPDGSSVYVTNYSDSTVSEFDVGTGGVLTPKSTPTAATGSGPVGIAVRPPPAVLGVSPASGPVTGGTQITITGSGFVPGATVEIAQGKGASATAIPATNVTVVSQTEITATTGGPAKAGSFKVFVTDSGGTSFPTPDDGFTYTRPSVSGVSPATGPVSGGTAITITGARFRAGDSVLIGQGNGPGSKAIPATGVDVVSPTEITATTGGPAKPGTWNVFVTESGIASTANPHDHYTYTTSPPAPSATPR